MTQELATHASHPAAVAACTLARPSHGLAGQLGGVHSHARSGLRAESAIGRPADLPRHGVRDELRGVQVDGRAGTRDPVEPEHFFAQLKYAELHYRLRALIRAEQETLKASELAANPWEFSLARKQLQEIRRLMREGTQKPEWTKPLKAPAFACSPWPYSSVWWCIGNESNKWGLLRGRG